MRKIFYPFLCVFSCISLWAQTPGGVAGSVLWLKANAGASPSTWTDFSGYGNTFTQPTGSNQPATISPAFNFNPALGFNGVNSYMSQPTPTGFPGGSTDRTIFVVANATDITGYRWIMIYGNTSSVGNTFQTGNNGGALSNAFYGSGADINSGSFWNAAGHTNGALGEFTLAGGTNETQYDRGVQFNTQTTAAPLTAASTNGIIGAINTTGTESWKGNIAEIVLYPTLLTTVQRRQVESYLALKYGFTLGNTTTPISYTASNGAVIWPASSAYQNDVFGIGMDNGSSLNQTSSNSMNSGAGDGTGQSGKGNLVLSGATLSDVNFLIIGNDAGPLTEHVIASGEGPFGSTGSTRVIRNWKVQNMGHVGATSLSFDMTGLTLAGGPTASNYTVMVDGDGDGNYSTGVPAYYQASSITGNKINFTGVVLPNNAEFTIVTAPSATLPAKWAGFSVTVQKNKALLAWKTTDELNVDRYTVEYSEDGISYAVLGSVTAKNNSGINTYSMLQDNLPSGLRYYHIRRYDKDGKFEFSEVKKVRIGAVTSVLIRSNPVTLGRLELVVSSDQGQEATVRIISMNGSLMLQQRNTVSAGDNNLTANLQNLVPGTYILQVQLADQIINKKFIRQ
jgi:hypothetical protein